LIERKRKSSHGEGEEQAEKVHLIITVLAVPPGMRAVLTEGTPTKTIRTWCSQKLPRRWRRLQKV
jgi:hypothetical protein